MDEQEKMESEMRDLFGITEDSEPEPGTSPDPQSEPSTTATPDEEPQQGKDTSEGNTDNSDPVKTEPEKNPEQKPTPVKDTTLDPEEKFSKQNSAFAQMRIQNKELSELLLDLAKATGQNPKNLAEAQTMLKEGLTKVESKKRNIPEDVLREMEDDKKELAELRQKQAKQRALSGFQQVKDVHGLTREEVNSFADKLIEKNLNPFEQELDLVKEYRNLYFDDLIAKAKEAGAAEERARITKAQQNSTTPSTQKGLPEGTGTQETPIKTVKALNELLDSLK